MNRPKSDQFSRAFVTESQSNKTGPHPAPTGEPVGAIGPPAVGVARWSMACGPSGQVFVEGENAMRNSLSRVAMLCAALCLIPTAAWAQFNGLKVNQRVFNDYPNSTLTVTNSNTIPGNVTIDDRNMV